MPADHSLYLSREQILSVLMSVGIVRKFFVHLFLPIPIPMIKAQTHNRPMVKGSNITEPSRTERGASSRDGRCCEPWSPAPACAVRGCEPARGSL